MGFCRKPRTTSELRAHYAYEVDGQNEQYDVPPTRGKRRNLPTWYDDLIAIPDNSWKRHRKTQWRPKQENKIKKHSKFRGHINPKQLRQRTKHAWCKRYIYNHKHNLETGNYDSEIIGYYWKWQTNVVYFYEGCAEKEYRYEEAIDKDYI